MKATKQLKDLLFSDQPEFLMEAHNGISAKIVEEAGFKGIWASGFSIAASLGVRDCNEASWTQTLDIVEFMRDSVSIPILLDGDTGYGNFNNVSRLVRKLEQRGIAGLCIEDKLFPKVNSFVEGQLQPLANIEEFCGRLKAAKDTQKDSNFVLVARTEGFIAQKSIEEVLDRVKSYQEAGADAVLVHSKASTIDEIKGFIECWDHDCPLIVVPTTYYQTDYQIFRDLEIDVVIWGNHMLRSAVTQMKIVAKEIFEKKSLASIQNEISSLKEIFRLQNMEELSLAEKKYMPNR